MAIKLLLDENISRRLIPFLQEHYPGSSHVALLGLEQADDQTIWRYAKAHGYAIVTKDADYADMSVMLGLPPPVIWLRTGNLNKAQTLKRLQNYQQRIEESLSQGLAFVEIY